MNMLWKVVPVKNQQLLGKMISFKENFNVTMETFKLSMKTYFTKFSNRETLGHEIDEGPRIELYKGIKKSGKNNKSFLKRQRTS